MLYALISACAIAAIAVVVAIIECKMGIKAKAALRQARARLEEATAAQASAELQQASMRADADEAVADARAAADEIASSADTRAEAEGLEDNLDDQISAIVREAGIGRVRADGGP